MQTKCETNSHRKIGYIFPLNNTGRLKKDEMHFNALPVRYKYAM